MDFLHYIIFAKALSIPNFPTHLVLPSLYVSLALNQLHSSVFEDSHPSPPHHPAPSLRARPPGGPRAVPGQACQLSSKALWCQSPDAAQRLLPLFLPLLSVAVVT